MIPDNTVTHAFNNQTAPLVAHDKKPIALKTNSLDQELSRESVNVSSTVSASVTPLNGNTPTNNNNSNKDEPSVSKLDDNDAKHALKLSSLELMEMIQLMQGQVNSVPHPPVATQTTETIVVDSQTLNSSKNINMIHSSLLSSTGLTTASNDNSTLPLTNSKLINTEINNLTDHDQASDIIPAPINNQTPPVAINDISSATITETHTIDPTLMTSVPSATIVPNTSSTTQASTSYTIAPPVGQSGWDEAVNQRIVWMASQNIQSATLNVSPEHLGPIQVHIQMENQQANVQFFSAQIEVRQALQNAMPQLNQLFSQNGIQLGQTDVSSQNFGSNAQQQSQYSKPKSSANELLSIDPLTPSKSGSSISSKGAGLLNIYA